MARFKDEAEGYIIESYFGGKTRWCILLDNFRSRQVPGLVRQNFILFALGVPISKIKSVAVYGGSFRDARPAALPPPRSSSDPTIELIQHVALCHGSDNPSPPGFIALTEPTPTRRARVQFSPVPANVSTGLADITVPRPGIFWSPTSAVPEHATPLWATAGVTDNQTTFWHIQGKRVVRRRPPSSTAPSLAVVDRRWREETPVLCFRGAIAADVIRFACRSHHTREIGITASNSNAACPPRECSFAVPSNPSQKQEAGLAKAFVLYHKTSIQEEFQTHRRADLCELRGGAHDVARNVSRYTNFSRQTRNMYCASAQG
ncbi:hypothetical protein C8R45DRAFT_931211 [Mycena sanguinolenta]|nr:hypothetical protein C8R45DRAFT_931211 [Mycena sanguinolenta]